MALALFVDRFAEWVVEYNTARPHSALGGQTPLQRWEADPTPIHEVPAEQLRWLLLADVERTIQRDGVHFGGHIFIAGELNGRVGERVQIRYTPHDLRQIEVFRGDTCRPPTRDRDRGGRRARRRRRASRRGPRAL
jgi:putative transposase